MVLVATGTRDKFGETRQGVRPHTLFTTFVVSQFEESVISEAQLEEALQLACLPSSSLFTTSELVHTDWVEEQSKVALKMTSVGECYGKSMARADITIAWGGVRPIRLPPFLAMCWYHIRPGCKNLGYAALGYDRVL